MNYADWVFAAMAYSLFTIFSLNQFYEEFVLEDGSESLPILIADITLHLTPLVILILFFIGIVKKETYINSYKRV